MASRVLLHFFVIVALVFVASADGDGGYKLLEYGEELSAHPWQDLVQRARTPGIQRRQFRPTHHELPPNDQDSKYEPKETKRRSSFEDTNELDNFRKESGVKVIYSRMPMPVILVSSYPKPKH